MNLYLSSKCSYVATIEHLKELKQICEESGYICNFSNNDLLFARFLDQNVDAALKVFTVEVANQLESRVEGF